MVSIEAGRFLTYAVAFVGLMAFLFASAGLIGLILAETVFRSHNLLSAGSARDEISYFAAALIVGTPLWLGFWRLAQRRVARSSAEIGAPERRLFFALTFAVTSVVALFALHTVLRSVLMAPSAHDTESLLRDGVAAGIRLLVYGTAWVVYTRLAWRERSGNRIDPARDLALHVLSAFSLVFLAIGMMNAIAAVVDEVIGASQTVVLGDTPGTVGALWGSIAAWIISGGAVWAVVSRYDQSYPRIRSFRVPYLYIVLAVAVGMTLGFGSQLGFELLRRAFGYHTGDNFGYNSSDNWTFLHDLLPALLTGAVFWAYHWRLLNSQTELEKHPGRIPWPRRPYLAALSFVGLAMSAGAAVTLLWVMLDAHFKTHDLVAGVWWRDQLSAGIALLAIGAVVWLRPWSILQAASVDPVERSAQARRWLLGAIVLVSTLAGVGFAIALLWLLFRMALGGPHDASTIGDSLRYLSAVLVAGALLAYYGQILRGDLREAPARAATRRRIGVLLVPGAESLVPELRLATSQQLEVIGYLTGPFQPSTPTADLPAMIGSMPAETERAMLLLSPEGGTLYPYHLSAPAPTSTGSSGLRPHSISEPSNTAAGRPV